ncbi:MAG: electron transport complex subunit RsxB [Burkholderiales bacterium]|nr:electron transport complex subunit RsxB [Burkholderiales bacterium]
MPAVTAPASTSDLAERIDALLPQTQCTKCGFAGCRPYADAIASGAAEINQCPPGGQAGIVKLAALMARTPLPLNPANGVERPLTMAVIDEALCIGCTLCIQACPVDAIVGAAKRMHTVLPENCTGCDLCVAPCPMDCIAMVLLRPALPWTQADADAARARFEARRLRLAHEARERDERLEAMAIAKLAEITVRDDLSVREADQKKAAVQAAIERARARRLQTGTLAALPRRTEEDEGAGLAAACPPRASGTEQA